MGNGPRELRLFEEALTKPYVSLAMAYVVLVTPLPEALTVAHGRLAGSEEHQAPKGLSGASVDHVARGVRAWVLTTMLTRRWVWTAGCCPVCAPTARRRRYGDSSCPPRWTGPPDCGISTRPRRPSRPSRMAPTTMSATPSGGWSRVETVETVETVGSLDSVSIPRCRHQGMSDVMLVSSCLRLSRMLTRQALEYHTSGWMEQNAACQTRLGNDARWAWSDAGDHSMG